MAKVSMLWFRVSRPEAMHGCICLLPDRKAKLFLDFAFRTVQLRTVEKRRFADGLAPPLQHTYVSHRCFSRCPRGESSNWNCLERTLAKTSSSVPVGC
eukprot:scaffold1671_cov344-Pavlova_lutheri.AAC.1